MKPASIAISLSLTCLVIATAPALAESGTGPEAALPTGDSALFRERMLGWNEARLPAVDEAALDVLVGSAEASALGLPLHRMPQASSRFGTRSDPLGAGRRLHTGVDLPGLSGTQVLATGAGTVRFSGWASGYGNMVEIDHGSGLHTRYGHLLIRNVRVGQAVHLGVVVGLMGSTGRSTGNHLHYEVRLGGRPIQPFDAGYLGLATMTPITAWLPTESQAQPRWQGWDRAQGAAELPFAVIF